MIPTNCPNCNAPLDEHAGAMSYCNQDVSFHLEDGRFKVDAWESPEVGPDTLEYYCRDCGFEFPPEIQALFDPMPERIGPPAMIELTVEGGLIQNIANPPKYDSVDLIAMGYEWTCPRCDSLNRVIEVADTVRCQRCGTVCQVDDIHHAHGGGGPATPFDPKWLTKN